MSLVPNLFAAIFGIALVVGFLGILAVWVKAPPLLIIMVGVVTMMIWDVIKTLREGQD